MKYMLCIILCCISLNITAQADTTSEQHSDYEKLLKKNIEFLDAGRDEKAFENILKRFERLKDNAPKEWLPLYYAAYCKIRLAGWNKDEQFLDEAVSYLKKANELNNSAESHALIARVYMSKIELNISNAPKFTAIVKTSLKEAVELEKNNPRVFLIYGRYYYYFPKFVGGDKEKAMKLFKKAKTLFDIEYERNQKEETVLPHWGRKLNAWHIENF